MMGIFVGVAVLLGIVSIIGVAVAYFLQKDKKSFQFRSLFSAYFYLVAMISLLAVFIGLSSITKAVASDVMGRGFSYYQVETRSEAIDPGFESDAEKEKFVAQQEEYQRQQNEEQYQQDLFNGISSVVVGTLFLIVHVVGWRRMESAKERQQSIFYKGYVLLQLVMYSLIALTMLPTGISETLRYVMSDRQSLDAMPGESLSLAIWATPLWLFFIGLTFRVMRSEQKA